MKRLVRLDKNDFEGVWNIMEASFPVDERRNREGQERILSNPYYRLYGYKEDGVLAAFIAVWEFPDFMFGEHFAVEKSHRNSGLGAKLIQELLEEFAGSVSDAHPFVFEVEPPENELAQRRIGFYERNGFVMNDYEYVQPAMSAEGKAIPLKIMSGPGMISPQTFGHVRDMLYRHVYRVL